MRWSFTSVPADTVTQLARDLGVPPLLARLLVLRGIDNAERGQRFLYPSLTQLHDPNLMADMHAAVARLRTAIERQEKILIYGDYDVDGAMAVVVLFTALKALGARVETYIPHRTQDGYGMRVPVIERAAAEDCGVVLSVDTGIRAHEVIGRALELGVDCIVTDHHLPGETLPPACAVLNPQRRDCGYPEKHLSGVGVAFKLVQALFSASGRPLSAGQLQSYLKVVALGTIADVVPLVGENRVIAHFGLAGLRQPIQKGLRELLEVAGLRGRAITAGDIGFRLAPRLNAAGRMESAQDVIDLLTTSDGAAARQIAERLDSLNRERQLVEEQILREIVERVEGRVDNGRESAGNTRQDVLASPVAVTGALVSERYSLVFAGKGWHRGVIGIVAQRMVDRYHRPALVISIEDGLAEAEGGALLAIESAMGHGSGRSIPGFHLLDALTSAKELFERYGGHAQAAGFTLPAQRILDLEAALEAYARRVLTTGDLEPALRVDAGVSLRDVDWSFWQALKRLEPFGPGNPTPVFAARDLRVTSGPHVIKEKHLKLRVAQETKSFEAVAWGWAAQRALQNAEGGLDAWETNHRPRLVEGQQIEMAFNLEEHVFEELSSLQLIIKDVR